MNDFMPREAHDVPEGLVWGVIVTYQRSSALASLLHRLESQTLTLDHLIVVDNGSDPHVRLVVETANGIYVDAGDNLGPAGGIALGMEYVLQRAGSKDWLVLFDDDDPPSDDAVLEKLRCFAEGILRDDERTAAVGCVGARFSPQTGTTHRVPDSELGGPVSVDYIGGGQFPMYRCAALRHAGVFDADLFFGFDDLEHGLRLRSQGYSLYVSGEDWLELRENSNRLNLAPNSLRSPNNQTAWRRYYGVRNITLIARRYAKPWAPFGVATLGGLRGALALARSGRPFREVVLPVRGAIAGLLGRSGRTIDPGSAAKVA